MNLAARHPALTLGAWLFASVADAPDAQLSSCEQIQQRSLFTSTRAWPGLVARILGLFAWVVAEDWYAHERTRPSSMLLSDVCLSASYLHAFSGLPPLLLPELQVWVLLVAHVKVPSPT
jgi:hypothetical protein